MKRILIITCLLWGIISCTKTEDTQIDNKTTNTETSGLYALKQIQTTKGIAPKDKLWTNGQTIKIKFLNGTEAQKNTVKQYAAEWLNYANLQFDYVESGNADVKISFKWNNNGTPDNVNWSYVGTDAKVINQNYPSTNFGNLSPVPKLAKQQVLILFGHILGLVNEHHNPTSTIQWDTETVYAYYEYEGWATEEIDEFFFANYNSSNSNYSEFDPKSIMVWPIEDFLTLDYEGLSGNYVLSDIDKEFIGELYPFTQSYTGEWINFITPNLNGTLSQTSVTSGMFLAACIGNDGKTYFGSQHDGIWKLEDGSFTQINSTSFPALSYMVLGPDGNIYLGDGNGVSKLNSDNTVTPIIRHGSSTNYVKKDNDLYVPASFNGVWKIDSNGNFEHYASTHFIGGMFLTLGQDGLLYVTGQLGSQKSGIYRVNPDKTLTTMVSDKVTLFWDGILGNNNKTYFVTNNTMTEGGIWRLDDDGEIRQTSRTTGEFKRMFNALDGNTYFLNTGIISRSKPDGGIENINCYTMYCGENVRNHSYLFNNGTMYRLTGGAFGAEVESYRIKKTGKPMCFTSQVAHDNNIYIFDDNDGIYKYTLNGENDYSTTLRINGTDYNLNTFAINNGYGNIKDMLESELETVANALIEHIKTENGYETLEVSNKVYKPI